jgi:hypothetical protein
VPYRFHLHRHVARVCLVSDWRDYFISSQGFCISHCRRTLWTWHPQQISDCCVHTYTWAVRDLCPMLHSNGCLRGISSTPRFPTSGIMPQSQHFIYVPYYTSRILCVASVLDGLLSVREGSAIPDWDSFLLRVCLHESDAHFALHFQFINNKHAQHSELNRPCNWNRLINKIKNKLSNQNFNFSTASRSAPGSTQPSVQWVGGLVPGVKWQGEWGWPLPSN